MKQKKMKNPQELLRQLTLEEKASLCSGRDFWHPEGIERLEIPSIMVTDGPHGVRKQTGDGDHIGIGQSIEATCFPTASATASSWNPELMKRIGDALAEECLQEKVSVLLGPGVNIKRSPLCGRNFEYISEDPYLTGLMGAALVKGIQAKGIGTSLKHYAVNNQEYRRLVIDSVVDERALREIYLAGFETVVKESQPWTVMCAYNKVNGTYCSDNKKLLTDILKEEWGHTGLVMTDWGACNDRVEGIRAGLELEMPSSGDVNDKKIIEAVKKGELSEEDLDRAVLRVLELIKKADEELIDDYMYDIEEHNQLAREAAAESIVLLKNEDDILPLNKNKNYAIIGEFARNPRYQGAGSSLINPIMLQNAISEFDKIEINYSYSKGYDLNRNEINEKLIKEAVEAARTADIAIIFAGLPAIYESEGYDRETIDLPDSHNKLINSILSVNENVIIVLQNGAPVAMPWINDVKAVLECYLGGQAGGPAAVDVLFGNVNPSAKLAETFPLSMRDNSVNKWFGMGPKTVEYRESIYVGYRYYDIAKQEVLFPFGYGLSYTNYEYSDLNISKSNINADEKITITFRIKNTGDLAGSEIVQLYVSDIKSTIYRPEKELKGFKKIYLEPGEEKTISISLDFRSFAYYNVNIQNWHVETGEFEILIGASSRDIRLKDTIYVESNDESVSVPDYRDSAPEYYSLYKGEMKISDQSFKEILGREIPEQDYQEGEEFTKNSTLGEINDKLIGKLLYKIVKKQMGNNEEGRKESDKSNDNMLDAMLDDMPLRSMVLFSGGKFSFRMLNTLLLMLNGRFFKGLFYFIFKN